jgi:hypothetical protein
VIRRKPKRQCRIYLSMKKFSPSCTKFAKFPSPLKPAMVTEESKSQLSLLSHPGPPHLSAHMYAGRPTEAHAWGYRRRRVRNEYTNCKTSFVRVSHCEKTERKRKVTRTLGCGSPQPGDPTSGIEIRTGTASGEAPRLSATRSMNLVQSFEASRSTSCED